MSTLDQPAKPQATGPSPRNSSVALLGDRKPADDNVSDTASLREKAKRKLFGLGKKKEDKGGREGNSSTSSSSSKKEMQPPVTPTATLAPNSINTTAVSSPPKATPTGSPRIYASSAASPTRLRSSSPRLHSPASSQIFERNVQETASLHGELSPAIPAHIQTEDHIPPALDASSLAITDSHLNPDEVEIVMHAAHQPAAVPGSASSALSESVSSPTLDEVASYQQHSEPADEGASNYGALDKDDVRRLSFISFADVVQAEHAETSRDSVHQMSLSSTTANRSPSPIRSPASSHGMGTSPPTSGAPSMKGMDGVSAKGARSPIASPTVSASPPLPVTGGELMVETMRQALRKTGSGDLSGARSQPLSAVSAEDAGADRPPFR
ncbi:hypothetical protein K490DRAFT_49577 [Saccharata proteae CBS 121410]|uniref:Uncharacterized protein n=1 Tax=Saccharata proteae CBS 121410 TaxID=1314787 RepID=A0A9P4LS86_9PEZI|nr:hypothetical protein K490DRAFT_49577 [Saccharata proteae CBS 121410]